MIPVAKPYFPNKDEILKALNQVLETGRLMDGPYNLEFEKEFAKYTGTKYAIAVNSCTTALEIILRFIGIEDCEVILPTNTFLATANAALYAGGRPVLVDVKEGTYHIDVSQVAKKITKKTRAVVAVHIAGFVCENIHELQAICRKSGLLLLEDCAHAIGASYQGIKAGTFGLAGAFSFYPTKIITTGTGGMITTDSADLDAFARSARCHGRGAALNDIDRLGNDWFMDEFRAAIGLSQLHVLDSFIEKRRKIAAAYRSKLSTCDGIRIFEPSADSQPSFYKFPIQITKNLDMPKMRSEFPKRHNFELESLYWPTCHLQPIYKRLFKYRLGDFPVAEGILDRQVLLPMHPLVTDAQIDEVVNGIKTYVQQG